MVGFELLIGIVVLSNSINFGESFFEQACMAGASQAKYLARTYSVRRDGGSVLTTVLPSFVWLFPAPRSTCNSIRGPTDDILQLHNPAALSVV